jgi:hypothetical protein
MTFVTNLFFYGEGLLAPRPTPNLEDHPMSFVRGCLFNIFAVPPSTTLGRTMLWLRNNWRISKRVIGYIYEPGTRKVNFQTQILAHPYYSEYCSAPEFLHTFCVNGI